MDLYKGYTTKDLLLDKPCNLAGICTIYPIKVVEQDEFYKYAKYLILGREHLHLPNEITLLDGIILIYTKAYEEVLKDKEKAFERTKEELSKLFTMICHIDISCDIDEMGLYFHDKDDEIQISGENFDTIRLVVMRMNLLREPKYFEDEYTQKWYNKALIAREKARGKQPEMDDILLTISVEMKISFEEMLNLNIFQLYAYFYRIVHVKNYEASIIFKAVGSKVNVDFSDCIIEDLYKIDDSDLYVDADKFASQFNS